MNPADHDQQPDTIERHEDIEEANHENEPLPERKQEDPKDRVQRGREGGKSLLPIARVQKIVKADKDIPIVSREAIFVISLATEEFIKRLSEASQRVASREKRLTVQQRDIETVVRQADEFAFLDEIMQWIMTTKRKPAVVNEQPKGSVHNNATMLDKYVSGPEVGTMSIDADSSQSNSQT